MLSSQFRVKPSHENSQLSQMPNGGIYYLKIPMERMRIHSIVGFCFGEKASQKATNKLLHLSLPKKRKLNKKGRHAKRYNG